jgi:PTH1 family peptidyl-tRNA hydrolase
MISLIVGLGNPGKEHEGDRHNAGADFVLALARTHNVALKTDKKYFGFTGKFSFDDRDVHLLIPTTYMNLSGKSVAALATFYKITPEQILVCHDELDFPPGEIRLKKGGGHGGHNGLRDTIAALGNQNNFLRLRIGIGHPGDANLVADYVLKSPPKSERKQIEQGIEKALAVTDLVLSGQIEKAMHQLHSKD